MKGGHRPGATRDVEVGRGNGVRNWASSICVEGTVRTESGRLRVTAEVDLRARPGARYGPNPMAASRSMLELQRELSAAIARQVRLRLSPDRLTALAPRHREMPRRTHLTFVAATSGIG